MKPLYVTDLDGTLLDSDQHVSDRSAKMLREAADRGAYFTFATARTAASAVEITRNIGVNIPCVLMNGVSVYNISDRKYVRNEYISPECSKAVADLLDGTGQSGFMYKISGDKLSCEYTILDNPSMRQFFEMRRDRYDKKFGQIDCFASECTGQVVYFALLDSFERLEPVRRAAEKIKGLKYEFYRDIYNPEVYYLEIFSGNASKFSGVRFLRSRYGFDKVVCFGDNLNDSSMFAASDVKIAVANAHDELKAAADEVIGPNTSDSVAEFILESTFK